MNKVFAFQIFPIFFLSLLFCPVVNAQKSPEYHANFPQGNAEWKMTFEKKTDSPTVAPQGEASLEKAKHAIKDIDVVRHGDLRRDEVNWSDGTISEFWWPTGASFVLFEAKNKAVATVKPSQLGDRRLDETVFTWVNGDTFQREEFFRGRKCFYFKGTLAGRRDTDTNEKTKKELEAWIDAETMVPVAWSNGANLIIYKFKEKPGSEPLVMPEKFRQEYVKWSVYLDSNR